jgi:hypothetical protein
VAKPPILKPREVVALLEQFGFPMSRPERDGQQALILVVQGDQGRRLFVDRQHPRPRLRSRTLDPRPRIRPQ